MIEMVAQAAEPAAGGNYTTGDGELRAITRYVIHDDLGL